MENNEVEVKKPVKVFRVGFIKGTVWVNKNNEGNEFFSVNIVKSYKVKDTQEWKNTNSFNKSDMASLVVVTQLVNSFLYKE